MSIEAMIREHPQVGSNYNEALGRAVKHAMYCSAICASCADACLAETMDMSQCVRTCLDCADICEATARVALRRTGSNREVIVAQLQACIRACEICGAECAQHDAAHCQRCARMCRECANDCQAALEGVQAELASA